MGKHLFSKFVPNLTPLPPRGHTNGPRAPWAPLRPPPPPPPFHGGGRKKETIFSDSRDAETCFRVGRGCTVWAMQSHFRNAVNGATSTQVQHRGYLNTLVTQGESNKRDHSFTNSHESETCLRVGGGGIVNWSATQSHFRNADCSLRRAPAAISYNTEGT